MTQHLPNLAKLGGAARKANSDKLAEGKTMPRHHTVIAGTGRAGTTLLVKLLTRLGLPTGFDPDTMRINELANAGLERDIRREKAPYIVKKPSIVRHIDQVLARPDIVIDHVIVCMRTLKDAAESRRAVHNKRLALGRKPHGPGALWTTGEPDKQERVLAKLFYKLIFELTAHDISITYLHFPRFARDRDYLYRKLHPIFPTITEYDLARACEAEIVADEIHDFSDAAKAGRRQNRSET
jgi:hypothetical protein